jgi:putative toxin-antitoxin system antitoxin component (TIGR02293 family)
MQPQMTLEAMLGGKAALRRQPKTPKDWHQLLEAGLPLEALETFKGATSMSDTQLASLVGISGKTLQRARSQGKRLDAVASDRLFRTARIVALAAHVLGSGERGVAWLSRAQIGLGGEIPFAMMTTQAGCDQVEKLLLRIEYGVYS